MKRQGDIFVCDYPGHGYSSKNKILEITFGIHPDFIIQLSKEFGSVICERQQNHYCREHSFMKDEVIKLLAVEPPGAICGYAELKPDLGCWVTIHDWFAEGFIEPWVFQMNYKSFQKVYNGFLEKLAFANRIETIISIGINSTTA